MNTDEHRSKQVRVGNHDRPPRDGSEEVFICVHPRSSAVPSIRGFRGFPPEAVAFFRGLARNNRREWFQPRKQIFEEQVKRPMVELITSLTRGMMRFAPEYVMDPEKAIYRIYRDTRFSPDKTPYKTHIGATFTRRGLERHASAGLYFSVSHKEVEVAGGVYMPTNEELLAIRTYLAEHHAEFRRLIAARSLRSLMGDMHGDQLSRVPKGFCAEHPAADLLRYKQFLFYVLLDPAMVATPKLESEVSRRFRILMPFIEFLNRPLVEAARRTRVNPLG